MPDIRLANPSVRIWLPSLPLGIVEDENAAGQAYANLRQRQRDFALQSARRVTEIVTRIPTFVDHFVYPNGVLPWNVTGTVAVVDDINGMIKLTVSAAPLTSRANCSNLRWFKTSLNIQFEWRVKTTDLAQRRVRVGFIGGTTTQDFVIAENNAVGATVNWFFKCDKAGTTTSVDTGLAGSTDFTYFLFVSDNLKGAIQLLSRTDARAQYRLLGTINSNIPTVRLQPYIELVNNNVATHFLFADVVRVYSDDSDTESAAEGIVFRDEQHGSDTTSAGTITITKPTGVVANDTLILAYMIAAGTVVTVPAGFTLVDTVSNGFDCVIYRKIAGTAEPATYAITYAAGGGTAIASIRCYGGADSVTPVDASAILDAGVTATPATSSITTSYDNAMVITTFFQFNATTEPTWTAPPGESERMDFAATAGGQPIGMMGADELQAVSGATGTKTATSTQNDQSFAHILDLRPA